MKSFLRVVLVSCCVFAAGLRAQEKDVPAKAAEELKAIAGRQKALLAEAATKQSQADGEDLRERFQALVFDYESYLAKYPGVAAGYVSYALLLNQPALDERKRAAALLLKANQLDPDLPLVKNQLGNYLAEEGKPLEALNYYLAAVKLAPKEPLYHYQVGTLLTEARDDFLKNPAWTRATLDQAMQDAFEQASALAPENVAYAYRFGESFYDLERPEWSAALEFWRALEGKVATPVEKETMRLHQANVLIHQGKFAEARAVLATVKEATLLSQKQKLVAQLPAVSAK